MGNGSAIRVMTETSLEETITPATLKSNVWKHYTTENKIDKTNAICKMCNTQNVKYTGSTTNLITHLKRHQDVDIAVISASVPASPVPRLDSSQASESGEQSVLTFF